MPLDSPYIAMIALIFPSTIARVHATPLHIEGRCSTYDFNDLLKRQSEADEECLRLLSDRSCERGVVAVPEDVVDEFFLVRSADHRCTTAEQHKADSRPKSTGTIVPRNFLVANVTRTSATCYEEVGRVTNLLRGSCRRHRSRIRYLSKKHSRILTNFPKLKKIAKIRKKNSLNARV